MRYLWLTFALSCAPIAANADDTCLDPVVIVRTSVGRGTGVIVRCEHEGARYRVTALTVAHVASSGRVTVNLPHHANNTSERTDTFDAEVVAATVPKDLAVLSFLSDKPLPVAVIDREPARVGDVLSRYGTASGSVRHAGGHVIEPDVATTLAKSNIRATVVTYPGDSGGPVYRRGKLIGLTSGFNTGDNGISFHVPITAWHPGWLEARRR